MQKLRRAGHISLALLILLTATLFIASSHYAWLGVGTIGIALMLRALVDPEMGSRVRAVMAASGLALTLFGFAPGLSSMGAHLAACPL